MPPDQEEKRIKPAHREAQMRNPRSSQAHPADQGVELQASFDPQGVGPRLAPVPVLPPAVEQVRLPPMSEVRCFNTTRLLPAKYSESVLTRIADNDEDLQLIFTLDSATNDRLLAEGNQRLGMSARELVFDVPHYRIINAAFTHPHPQGARFSMPYRGAWYAGLELATAKAEVLFHREVQFAEIGWQQPEELHYDQYTADFSGCFHDLRPAAFASSASLAEEEQASHLEKVRPCHPGGIHPVLMAEGEEPAAFANTGARQKAAPSPPTAAEFAVCLAMESYVASQQLTISLLEAGSLGILFPSVRRPGGNCIACFRPSVVANVRKRDLYRLRWYPDRPSTFVRSPRTLPSEVAVGPGPHPGLASPPANEAEDHSE